MMAALILDPADDRGYIRLAYRECALPILLDVPFPMPGAEEDVIEQGVESVGHR